MGSHEAGNLLKIGSWHEAILLTLTDLQLSIFVDVNCIYLYRVDWWMVVADEGKCPTTFKKERGNCVGECWIQFIFTVLLLKNLVLNVTSDESDNKDTPLCN